MLIATSLNLLFDYTADIARAVDRLADAGFEALDFNGIDQRHVWPDPAADEYVEQLARAAERRGLPFVQAHGPMFTHFKEPEHTVGVADTYRCLKWCARLGAPWMVMHPLPCCGSGSPAQRDEALECNLTFFRQFIPAMEEAGVGIAIENIFDGPSRPRGFGDVPSELIAIVDALDHELFGLCWDTGHAQIQKLPQREAIGSLGQRLKTVHVQDNDGVGDQHLMPYLGKIDWPAVMAGLADAGYEGAFCYETHNAVRPLPDSLRDEAMRLLVSVARQIVGR